MTLPDFFHCPPAGELITDYDERHHETYWRLLDADAQNTDWKETVRIVFKTEPDADLTRCRLLFETHLARARWITENGYRTLIGR